MVQFETPEQEISGTVQMKLRALSQCVISRQQSQFVLDIDQITVSIRRRFLHGGHIVQDTHNV